MNKLACYILICVMVSCLFKVPVAEGISAGCPLTAKLCTIYCKKHRFGREGKCIGPTRFRCKCYV
uniref:Toxin La-alphaKTx7 n=1 Tax=Liocheles australasiae TaxID=431266 RepID=KA117_LIOAU